MTNDPRFDGVRATIQRLLVERSLPSIAVAVAQAGTIIWEEGFGWADREQQIAATEHTTYSLASISKPITATGLMVLQERGKLDIDLRIDDYLGDAKLQARVGNASDATVRRVANHTSGLPVHYHFFFADEPHRRPSMDETIRRYANLVTAPGEHFQYSNLGYGLLDYVIERCSGMSYAEWMRKEVFQPLGMFHSSVDIGPGLEPYAAQRYGDAGTPLAFYEFDHPGGSAVYASAHDLIRFAMFHLKEHLADQKAVLSDTTLDQMQIPTAERGGTMAYGIGWTINRDAFGYHTVGHGGGMPGVNTTLIMVPSEQIAVAVLSNVSSYVGDFSEDIAGEILGTLLPHYGEQLAASRAADEQPPAPPSVWPSFEPSAQLLGEWQGTVHTSTGDVPLRLRFKEDGDVHARLGDQLAMLVNHTRLEDNHFKGGIPGVIPTPDVERRRATLYFDLCLHDSGLNGVVIAQSARYGLSHWAELRKVD